MMMTLGMRSRERWANGKRRFRASAGKMDNQEVQEGRKWSEMLLSMVNM